MVIISEVIGNTVMSSNFLNILQELPRGKKWLYSHFSGVKFYYIFQNHSQCLTGGTGGTTRKICVCGGGGGSYSITGATLLQLEMQVKGFLIFSVSCENKTIGTVFPDDCGMCSRRFFACDGDVMPTEFSCPESYYYNDEAETCEPDSNCFGMP